MPVLRAALRQAHAQLAVGTEPRIRQRVVGIEKKALLRVCFEVARADPVERTRHRIHTLARDLHGDVVQHDPRPRPLPEVEH